MASLPELMWQPIETAPRDGTEIDVWVDGHRVCNVHWSFSRSGTTGEPIDDPAWDGWAVDGASGQSYTPNYVRGTPTHWMPLPEPPA